MEKQNVRRTSLTRQRKQQSMPHLKIYNKSDILSLPKSAALKQKLGKVTNSNCCGWYRQLHWQHPLLNMFCSVSRRPGHLKSNLGIGWNRYLNGYPFRNLSEYTEQWFFLTEAEILLLGHLISGIYNAWLILLQKRGMKRSKPTVMQSIPLMMKWNTWQSLSPAKKFLLSWWRS